MRIAVAPLVLSVVLVGASAAQTPEPFGGEEFNYIVGTGACVQPEPRTTLVAVQLLSTVTPPDCTNLFMTESTPTSSSEGRPVVVDCDEQVRELRLFGEPDEAALPGRLLLNAPGLPPVLGGDGGDPCYVVSGATIDFGTLKARF